MPALSSFSPKPEPLVGPTGREALLCLGSAACTIQSFRAENPLEVGARARNDVARDVRILDGCVAVGERAPLRAQLLRRHDDAAGALDQFVKGFGIADHLVLL